MNNYGMSSHRAMELHHPQILLFPHKDSKRAKNGKISVSYQTPDRLTPNQMARFILSRFEDFTVYDSEPIEQYCDDERVRTIADVEVEIIVKISKRTRVKPA
jgi:hypothetical protein